MKKSEHFWKRYILGFFLILMTTNMICSGAPFSGNHTYDQLQNLISDIPNDSDYLTEYLNGINETTKDSSKSLYYGKVSLKAGNVSEAERQFSLTITSDPSNKAAWTGLFASLSLQEQYEKLRNQSSNRLNITPYDADAWLEKGFASLNLDDFTGALDAFKQVLRIDPKNILAHYYSAWTYGGLNQNQNAIKEYEKVSLMAPEYGGVSGNIAFLLVGDNQYEEALPYLNKALEWNPNWTEALRTKGMVLYNQDKKEEAISTWDNAIQIDPPYVSNYLSKGEALTDMGKYEEALKTAETGLYYDVNNTDLGIMKGDNLISLKRYDEAKSEFDNLTSYIETLPEGQVMYYQAYISWKLGEIYEGLGNNTAASENYNQALGKVNKILKDYPDTGFFWHFKSEILNSMGNSSEAKAAEDQAQKLKYIKYRYL